MLSEPREERRHVTRSRNALETVTLNGSVIPEGRAMNEAQFETRVAAESDLPKAAVERTVGAAFAVISDALTGGEEVADRRAN